MPVRCLVWRTKYGQARTDRYTNSEQGRGGLVHLQLGKAERYVDPGTKGSAAYHWKSLDQAEGYKVARQHV